MKTSMSKLFTLFLLLVGIVSFSQIGIGTEKPRGALDINSPLTSNSGLVLPTNQATTNIINPQGGSVAEGTIIYDSTEKCVKYYNGTAWSNCLCDSCKDESIDNGSSGIVLDCSANGFTGNYVKGQPLDHTNTFTVTVTNNTLSRVDPISFQPSDLVLSGASGGITVINAVPHSTFIQPGQSMVITFGLSGTPTETGKLTATFSKLSLQCTNSVDVYSPTRFGYEGTQPIASPVFQNTIGYNNQLKNGDYYGPNGIYKMNRPFIFSQVSLDSPSDLKEEFDILSVSANSFNNLPARVQKIKDFLAKGGVVIICLEHIGYAGEGTQEYIFNHFGNTGKIDRHGGAFRANASRTETFSDVFGNTRGTTITGASLAKINQSQLASGSRVFATLGNDVLLWTTEGEYDGRIIWSTDSDIFRDITGAIDTDQEKFLHNMMAYVLKKAGI